MSLVDYESSSSDEENEDGKAAGRLSEEAPPLPPPLPLPPAEGTAIAKPQPKAGTPRPTVATQEPPPPGSDLPKRSPVSSTRVQSGITSDISSASVQLPDASLLFSSPSFLNNQTNDSDHSSRVAAAMAENALRKRASNGSVPQRQQIKHHKGVSSVSNVTSDVKGGELIPPQLRGRSNVVTEDIGKLFVRKRS